MIRETDWTRDAPCRGKTDLFYSTRIEEIREAKAICGKCPFQGKECTAHMTASERGRGKKDRFGIADGKDPSERLRSIRGNKGKRQDQDRPKFVCDHCGLTGNKKMIDSHIARMQIDAEALEIKAS